MATETGIGIYREALVFLGTAGVVIPLMARLRISPVVGFLVAGLILGPNALGRLDDFWPWLSWIAITSQEAIDKLAELGVAFLLFTIGLELSFDRLWTMRRLVFGMGMSQVVLTTAAIGATAFAFGNPAEASLVIGACLALSSTAIVLQLLAEQQRLTSTVGRSVFSVLLAQDLAVVPILFLIIVFSGAADGSGSGATAANSVWAGLGLALTQAASAILLIVGIGRIVLRRLFRSVARTRNRELFMATILFVVVGASLLTHVAGLSMALGAFLAGLLLAETEFRHQVEVDIEPFKGILLGLFFLSVGMRIDLAQVANDPLMLAASIFGMVAIKAAVIGGLARLFGCTWPVAIESSLLLAGGGEFAFLVLSLGSSGGLMSSGVEQFMLLVASGTMLLTPILARLARKFGLLVTKASTVDRAYSDPGPIETGRTIVVGHGRIGRIVCDVLENEGLSFIAIERETEVVTHGRHEGRHVVYGDAVQHEFLRKCGLAEAPAVILTMHEPSEAEHVLQAIRAERADVPIVARARDAQHAKRLFALGATDVVCEVLEAGLELAGTTLQALGVGTGKIVAIIHDKRDTLKMPLRKGTTEPPTAPPINAPLASAVPPVSAN